MKKIFLLLPMLLSAISAFAYDVEIDGIYYKIKSYEEKTISVTYREWYQSSYSGDLVIPSEVTHNGTTYSVTSIGDEAFFNCTGLTSVTIPNSVTQIEDGAFKACTGLTSVSIPNSVTNIGSEAFSFCSSLTSICIPNSVAIICGMTFESCSSLTSITIPNSVKSIEWNAFFGCTSLTSITIPNSVTSIGGEAFSGCSALTSMTVEEGNPNYDSRDNCNAIIETSTNKLLFGCQNSVIPNSVTRIDACAFYECSTLTSITIPNSVTSIGNYAFFGCKSLASMAIPNSVTSIGNRAFSGCSSLTSMAIPNSVTNIGSYAFSDCSNLTSITIPNSVTSIGNRAFLGCSSLSYITVEKGNPNYDSRDNCNAIIETSTNTLISGCQNTVIPNSVTNIGNYAFFGCSGLTSITIPNSVTSIGDGSLSRCTALISITIPNSVTSIGNEAFYGCYNLEEIHSQTITPPTVDYSTFEGIKTNECKLYVPVGTKESYASVEGWKDFYNIVEEGVNAMDPLAMPNANATGASLYTLSGEKVMSTNNLPVGIYIKNSKKVLVR